MQFATFHNFTTVSNSWSFLRFTTVNKHSNATRLTNSGEVPQLLWGLMINTWNMPEMVLLVFYMVTFFVNITFSRILSYFAAWTNEYWAVQIFIFFLGERKQIMNHWSLLKLRYHSSNIRQLNWNVTVQAFLVMLVQVVQMRLPLRIWLKKSTI